MIKHVVRPYDVPNREALTDLPADRIVTGTGQRVRIHTPDKCAGGYCVFHSPSDHSMRAFPTHLREDRLPLVERICPHGIGHPDPDSLAYLATIDPEDRGAWAVHGCDGCCA